MSDEFDDHAERDGWRAVWGSLAINLFVPLLVSVALAALMLTWSAWFGGQVARE